MAALAPGRGFCFPHSGGDNRCPAPVRRFHGAPSPGGTPCSGGAGTSPLLLLGALRQRLQVELQHVPPVFVSAEVPLGVGKTHRC